MAGLLDRHHVPGRLPQRLLQGNENLLPFFIPHPGIGPLALLLKLLHISPVAAQLAPPHGALLVDERVLPLLLHHLPHVGGQGPGETVAYVQQTDFLGREGGGNDHGEKQEEKESFQVVSHGKQGQKGRKGKAGHGNAPE